MLAPKRFVIRVAALVALVFGLSAAPFSPASRASADNASRQQWEYLERDDGIDVWKLEIPGKELPGFRGQVIIDASIETILAEMMDSEHHTDWMYRCKESCILKELGADSAIAYNRTSAPWPVWDRDVILKVGYRYTADRSHLVMRFNNVDSDLRPVPTNTVRMPLLKGFYKMWRVGPNKTKVLYEVEADIGGSIPKWVAKKASKDLPYITLSKLRERVMDRHKRSN